MSLEQARDLERHLTGMTAAAARSMKTNHAPKQSTLANLELESLTDLTPAQLASVVGAGNKPSDCRLVNKLVAGIMTVVLVCGAGTGGESGPHLPEPGHPPAPGAPPVVTTTTPAPPPPLAPSPGQLRRTNPT